MIENNDVKLIVGDCIGYLIGFAGTDKKCRVRAGALGKERDNRFRPSRFNQQGEFLKTCGKVVFAKIDTNQSSTHTNDDSQSTESRYVAGLTWQHAKLDETTCLARHNIRTRKFSTL